MNCFKSLGFFVLILIMLEAIRNQLTGLLARYYRVNMSKTNKKNHQVL